MKNLKILLVAIVLIVSASLTVSCSDNYEMNEKYGKLTLKLSDAPLDYDQFKEANVTIEKIEIRRMDGDDGEFITMMNQSVKSNLLELVNGVTETLVDMELPEGNYDLIRLYMSSSEMVMSNGNSYFNEMNFGDFGGSMMQNGMMFNDEMESIDIPIEDYLIIMEGVHEEYLLDIDVNQSYMLEGIEYANGGSGMMMDISGFSFNPVMRFVQMSTSGTIEGTVQADGEYLSNATVTIMQSGEAYTSTHSDEDGSFKLIGIPEGEYSIIVELDGYIMDDILNESVMGSFDMMVNSLLNMNFYMTPVNN